MTDDLVKRLREASGQYDDHAWHSDIELEAADRIEQLKGILQRAVDAYDKAYCLDEVDFSWLDDARPALEGKK